MNLQTQYITWKQKIQQIYESCVVHKIRSSTRFVSWKGIKHVTADLKKIIYTTDIIEAPNCRLRQIRKNLPGFNSDGFLHWMLYLVLRRVVKYWHTGCQSWNLVISQLEILFAG